MHPRGEKALLRYAGFVHREWHDRLAQDQGFNIGLFNNALYNSISDDVWEAERDEGLKMVRSALPTNIQSLTKFFYIFNLMSETNPAGCLNAFTLGCPCFRGTIPHLLSMCYCIYDFIFCLPLSLACALYAVALSTLMLTQTPALPLSLCPSRTLNRCFAYTHTAFALSCIPRLNKIFAFI